PNGLLPPPEKNHFWRLPTSPSALKSAFHLPVHPPTSHPGGLKVIEREPQSPHNNLSCQTPSWCDLPVLLKTSDLQNISCLARPRSQDNHTLASCDSIKPFKLKFCLFGFRLHKSSSP
ncbi:hypothetical protein AMECASPLE_020229, partial [Ameca splendens]